MAIQNNLNEEMFSVIGNGKYKVWLDAQGGDFGRTMIVGESNDEMARRISEEVLRVVAGRAKPMDWLIDLNKNTRITSRARKIFVELQKNPMIGKMAFVGASVFVRVTVNFITAASGASSNVRHFAKESEALTWLKK